MNNVAILLLVVITFITFLVQTPKDKIVFLDVGQGDSILLQNGTKQVLIDGGPGMKVLERLGEEMPWFDRRIEVVVLTHPQKDHMEGLLHVLDRFEVGMVLLPEASHTSLMQSKWLERIIERDIPYRFAWAGQSLWVGKIEMKILGPFDSEEANRAIKSDLNNASVVMRVDYGEMSMLLTGDAEKKVEKMLVEYWDEETLNVDLYKAGHHGSKSSSTVALLEKSTPAGVIISAGKDNRFGHPHEVVLERFSNYEIWRTDEDGSVEFTKVGGEWGVE